MKQHCTHRECQNFHAANLAHAAEKLRRPDLLVEAVNIHRRDLQVVCQHAVEGRPSRTGAPNAPLPPRKEVT